MARLPTHPLLASALALLLSACATTGGSIDYPDQADTLVEQVPAWSTEVDGQSGLTLTDLVRSDALEKLVQQSMDANPGLQQTLLTLRIRETELRQAGADRLPSVEGSITASDGEETDDRYAASVTIQYEVDLWRKISDRTAAAGKDVEEQAALYRLARDTLAADVMTSWLALIAQQHAIAIQSERLQTLESNETLILQRYRNGLGTLEDLDSARSTTASARATLEDERESLARQERALKTLLGEVPATGSEVPGDYPVVLTPLAELPAQTLARRPDLVAAYRAIEAAGYRASAAYKDLLPSISLQAALEDVADSPMQSLLTNPTWSLLGQLVAPLFEGGALRAAADAAELETASVYQAYREALLNAVAEVEDALGMERSLAIREQHIADALARAQSTLAQYQSSYRSGLVDILDLLAVQQQTYDLMAQRDNLRYLRLVNRVDLGLALGLGVEA